MTVEGLDLSFSAPNVTPDWCAARLTQGYRVLVADLWTGNRRIPAARQALRLWREAGGIPAAYFVAHDGRPSREHFAEARAVAGSEWEHLSFVAVDVEVAPTSPQTVREACTFVQEEGQRPAVYTSRSKWQELCGNTTALQDVPLWDASYGQTPGLDMRPAYGGWQRRAGHQYMNTMLLDGIAVDLNLFDAAFVLGSPTPDEEWVNALNVLRGWSRQLAQASKELGDVADIVERLRPRS